MSGRYTSSLIVVTMLFVSALTLMDTVSAHATSARIRSLGGSGSYFEDSKNVVSWYGSLVDFPDEANLEIGDYDFTAGDDEHDQQATSQGGSIHFQIDEAGKWGTVAFHFSSEIPEPEPGGMFSALYGRKLGPLAIGCYFRGSSYFSYTQSDSEFKRGRSNYYHDLGLGLRFDVTPTAYVDLAGEVVNTKCDVFDEYREIDMENLSSWNSYGVRARAFIKLSEQVAFIPLFTTTRDQMLTYSDVLDDAADVDFKLIRAGLGLNIFPDADNMVVFSAEYRTGSDRLVGFRSMGAEYYTGERDYFSWRTRFGIESRLNAWLTLRAGTEYRRLDDQYLYDKPVGPGVREYDGAHTIDVEIALDLGIGLHFGAFDADVVFNDDAPFSFGHFLTGAGEAESATFTSVTLAYHF